MKENRQDNEDDEFDDFVFKIQQSALMKLWDNEEDEIWNNY
jgi:hypothetical protein